MQCSITPPLTPMPPTLKKKATPPPTCPGKDFKKKKEGMEFSQFQHSLQPALSSLVWEKNKRIRGEGHALILTAIPYRPLHSHPVSFRTFQPRSDSVHRLVFSIVKITPSSVTSGINFNNSRILYFLECVICRGLSTASLHSLWSFYFFIPQALIDKTLSECYYLVWTESGERYQRNGSESNALLSRK